MSLTSYQAAPPRDSLEAQIIRFPRASKKILQLFSARLIVRPAEPSVLPSASEVMSCREAREPNFLSSISPRLSSKQHRYARVCAHQTFSVYAQHSIVLHLVRKSKFRCERGIQPGGAVAL